MEILGFQLRHRTFGVLQAIIGSQVFWSNLSRVPQLGLLQFVERAEVVEVAHELVRRANVNPDDLAVEPFDLKLSVFLIENASELAERTLH